MNMSQIAAAAAAMVLTAAPLVVALPAQADSSNPQGANFGKLYYDGSVVRTVATPTSQRQLPRWPLGRERRQLEHVALPTDL